MAAGRRPEQELGARFADRPRQRSRREVVVEILAEGLWALICDGRGPGSRPSEAAGAAESRVPAEASAASSAPESTG